MERIRAQSVIDDGTAIQLSAHRSDVRTVVLRAGGLPIERVGSTSRIGGCDAVGGGHELGNVLREGCTGAATGGVQSNVRVGDLWSPDG